MALFVGLDVLVGAGLNQRRRLTEGLAFPHYRAICFDVADRHRDEVQLSDEQAAEVPWRIEIRTGRSLPSQIPKITCDTSAYESGSRREGVGRSSSNRSLDRKRRSTRGTRSPSAHPRDDRAARALLSRPGRVPGTRERLVPGTPYIIVRELWNEPLAAVAHGRRNR